MIDEKLEDAIELALRTWYPEGNDLRKNLHHPLGKLVGEWGELLDDYMKSIYKPDYVFAPRDELGDIWYYTRILIFISGEYPAYKEDLFGEVGEDELIGEVIRTLSTQFVALVKAMNFTTSRVDGRVLNIAYNALIRFADLYHFTLDDLTASNWQKLKPGSERGEEWTKATSRNS